MGERINNIGEKKFGIFKDGKGLIKNFGTGIKVEIISLRNLSKYMMLMAVDIKNKENIILNHLTECITDEKSLPM